MTDKQPVEKFRLTKEQLGYQKNYKQLVKMGKVVRNGIAQNMAKGASLGQMFQEIMGQLQQLKQQAPGDPMFELEGQAPEAGPNEGLETYEPTTGGVRN